MILCGYKLVLLAVALCLCPSPATAQQQGPVAVAGHGIPSTVRVVNGSQADVGCTGNQPNAFTCSSLSPGTPGGNTSFLVDRNVPEPLNFSGNTWASELMTVNHFGADFVVLITIDSMNATRAELVLFNCPDWGIGAVAIRVTVGVVGANVEELGSTALQTTSCDSLLTVCVPLRPQTTFSTYTINFENASDADIDWTHIAEVTFYKDSLECAEPFLVTPAPTEQPTTTGTSPPVTETVNTTLSTSVAPTTIGSTVPTNRNGSESRKNTIIAVVVVVIVVATVILILVIMVCMCVARRRRKQGKQEVEELQNALKEHKSIELSAVKEATQEAENEHQYHKTHHTWSGGKTSKVAETGELYSSIDNEKSASQSATQQDEMYATIREDEYAVVDKPAPPVVPEKADDLQVYLDGKGYSRLASPTGQPQLVQLTKPISGELLSNPAYDTVGSKSPATAALQQKQPAPDDVYTEPIMAAGPVYAVLEDSGCHGHPPQEIYENVYSVPLKPSLFMQQETSPSPTDPGLHPYGPIYTVPEAPPKNAPPMEVTMKNIKVKEELGDGQFGQVFLATTVGLSFRELRLGASDDKASVLVAVKMRKPGASKDARAAFEKEYKFMSRLEHDNVIRILGVCTLGDPPFIMMEYMEKGDLNHYLQQYDEVVRNAGPLSDGQVAVSVLLGMCVQIASAMQYLAARNFVHRDLATRNCLVDNNGAIKIADFGMSRHLYESHYYLIRGHAILPVRWMATECFYGLFSAKTDVWAFGVTMWEIFTLAKDEPYDGLTDQEVVHDAVKGESRMTLKKPEACPQQAYDVMLRCWVHSSADRATFEEALASLNAVNLH